MDKRIVRAAWPAVLLALLAFGCDSVEVGSEAPDFTLPDLNGKAVTMTGNRGKPVLISFTATWAAPCRLFHPVLSTLQQKYGRQGLTVIAVTFLDEAKQTARYFRNNPVGFTVLCGDETTARKWFGERDMILPLTFLVDEGGKVRAKFTGYHTGEDVSPEIEKLLAK